MKRISYRRELRSAGMSQGRSRGRDTATLRNSYLSQSIDKKTYTEGRPGYITFQGIRDRDPLGIQNRYRKKIKQDDGLSNTARAHANEKFLVHFYTCFTMIPIFLVLGLLFFSFWYLSPKSRNLRIYQQDIFRWNENHMAQWMSMLDFQYNIVPAGPTKTPVDFQFKDAPMAYEKDEISLRDKFFYKQAYFIKTQALTDRNISDVTWEEQNVMKIVENAANVTKTDKENIYQSTKYCLNVNYKIKNPGNETKFMELHSTDDPNDDVIEVGKEGQKPFQNIIIEKQKIIQKSGNTTEKMKELISSKDGEVCDLRDKHCHPDLKLETQRQQCLIPFHLWQEVEVDVFDSTFETVKLLRTKINEEIFDSNAKKECESDEYGIYMDEWCYYYQVLKKLCLKVKIVQSEKNEGSIDKVYFESGCYEDSDASLFKNTAVGQYYDFSHEVSIEVRSRFDPYMIFSYTKYNLGTDFTLFFYLSMFSFALVTYCILVVFYMFCCQTERIPDIVTEEVSAS